ncbi:bifunctional diguanylate cyclase/phosphodiesterase [Bordetella sp. FB-8]|uniref:putative bifunctional diguanylate cyclase/phosphodiesterase n=1 Tax=Bordetella sp. FB-8 TaxID=1159870 RepID=UPI00036CBE9A|nr:EAL domain-containing protein [Bordetella sp. FB-8]
MAYNDEALIPFADDALADPGQTWSAAVWQVLIVDDEPDVHAASKLALKGIPVEGRNIAFSHAHTAAQALTLLSQPNDFAVALIDVVMERDDAGLQLVRQIRETLDNKALRIILRTGQPGYAPEIDTIRQYDINDYRTKSELTQVRLFTCLTMAVRSYAQIRQLEAGRRGLEQILAASVELGKPVGLKKFASGVVTQLCALLNVEAQCLVCAAMNPSDQTPYVLAAAGAYDAWIGLPLNQIPESRVRDSLYQTLHARQHFLHDGASLYFQGYNDQALAAFVDVQRPLQALEKELLEVFCSNISVAFENLQLYLNINDLAYNDTLVHLPNRNALVEAIDARNSVEETVALLDLDSFADINSILDDSFGDAVLQSVAHKLRAAFPAETLVARLGSDLFGLYGPAQQVTPEKIAAVFDDPFAVAASEPLRLSATTGLVRLQSSAQTGLVTLKSASAALKQAKRLQRGKSLYFEATQADAARDRIRMLNHLRTSFSEERLFLHYQPFINLQDGRIVGAESLLRWKNTEGQFISPELFIPIAEQSGLMIPMGEWVARTAMKWRASLKGQVDANFRVAINVSRTQFAEPDFAQKFLEILDEAGLQGSQVEIELTESVAIENLEDLAIKLHILRGCGIRVAMDDFGTGYSSLSVIQRLQLDHLKIDRGFVSGNQVGEESFEIARTIITMADHLALTTIAEGIETQQQCDALLAAGCQEGQGYLFSRPLAETDFLVWLQDLRTSR